MPPCSSLPKTLARLRCGSRRSRPTSGFPPGAINVVTGRGPVAGAALASHPGVDFVSFTGSPAVGQEVQTLAAGHFAACTLELGGKSPHLVFGDADSMRPFR